MGPYSRLLVSTSAGALSIAIQAWPIQWTKRPRWKQSVLVSRRETIPPSSELLLPPYCRVRVPHQEYFSIYLIGITLVAKPFVSLSLPRIKTFLKIPIKISTGVYS